MRLRDSLQGLCFANTKGRHLLFSLYFVFFLGGGLVSWAVPDSLC